MTGHYLAQLDIALPVEPLTSARPTWTSLEALGDFVYGAFHVEVLRRRRWFCGV